MTELTKGANAPVPTTALRAVLSWSDGPGVPDVDLSALLLTADGKVRSDADFIFYNQPAHASGSVRHDGKQAPAGGAATDSVTVDLGCVEAAVEKVVVAASADGGTFGRVPGLVLRVLDAASGGEVATFAITGASTETAFVFGEFYRRAGAWKFRAVGQGYDTGLGGLAGDFGISVDEPAPAPAAPAAPTAPAAAAAPPARPAAAPAQPAGGVSLKKQKLISMEKKLESGGHGQLLSLTKQAAISLEKKGLGEHTARVALCLDISASMHSLFKTGKVQALAERVLSMGLRFDDDGQVDVFLFGQQAHEDGSIGMANYQGFADQLLRRHPLEGGTYYGKVMQQIRQHYFGFSGDRQSVHRDATPVYVMFITDGNTFDGEVTKQQVMASSHEPLFWQFMGIGSSSKAVDAAVPASGKKQKRGFMDRLAAKLGGDFEFLEQLDNLPGRRLDNANFFAVQDPANIPDEQLYDLMMVEYPGWFQQARQAGMLP